MLCWKSIGQRQQNLNEQVGEQAETPTGASVVDDHIDKAIRWVSVIMSVLVTDTTGNLL